MSRRAQLPGLLVMTALLISGCSVRTLAVNQLGNALATRYAVILCSMRGVLRRLRGSG